MRIQFWGTRGSLPKPGPETVRYGGNTSCVELVTARGTRVVLDCGTGAHGLGGMLMGAPDQHERGHILIGHTHWDHIQGLPFFAPLFVPGASWDIYAPRGFGQDLRETLAGQMQYRYFPVALAELGATIRYHELGEETFHIEELSITTQYLNHPALTLGFRIEVGGAVLVYATDHEPNARPLASGALILPGMAPRSELHAEDQRHIAFLEGADLLIHDAQYTAEEYPSKVGYGHSTIDYVVGVAREAGVGRLALFHHDPLRRDVALDEIVAAWRSALPAHTQLFAAAEGQVVELVERTAGVGPSASASAPATSAPYALVVRSEQRLVWVDAALGDWARTALGEVGQRIVPVDPSADLAERAQKERPAVLLLARRGPAFDAIELTRALRAASEPALSELPVVVLASAEEAGDAPLGFAAGVTDWTTWPASPAFIRARVGAWLARQTPRWECACVPASESQRLAAIDRLGLVDTECVPGFERLVRLAARALAVPVVAINIVAAEREWSIAVHGAPRVDAPRDVSLCAHTIVSSEAFVVSDAASDARYGDNPLLAASHMRFYAGLPLRTRDGHAVGALCVLDHVPRRFDADELRLFRDVAELAEQELAARDPRPE